MPLSRPLLPIFLSFALLFAQQGGAAHALSHAFEQTRQQDKQGPHSPACEQCEAYVQLGSALNVSAYVFALPPSAGEAAPDNTIPFRSNLVFAAAARGPPLPLQNIA